MKISDLFHTKKSDSDIRKIFRDQVQDEALMQQVKNISEPNIKYIVAITPRSGSSLLCDVMKNTHVFGNPGEILPQEFIPNIMQHAPAKNPDEYLKNVLKVLKSTNGISGLKTSWFQFEAFSDEMKDRTVLQQFKYIYLIRRDLFAQAVSLYKATSTSVFHSNIQHTSEALEKLSELEYDFEQIDEWYRHIQAQEAAWQAYFDEYRIFPLHVTYEDLEADVVTVVKRIAAYLAIPEKQVSKCKPDSIFTKLGDRSNIEWACRFALELDNKKRHGEYEYV